MRNEPNWLPLNEVIAINRATVLITREPFQILDMGLVESGLYKAQHHWEYNRSDTAVLAVQLFLGIAQNHGFEQGNKRTAWAAALMFLEINGYELNAALDSEKLGEFLRRIIIRKLSAERLVRILRRYARPLLFA